MERDYPIYLHCSTCQRCTRHCMIFDGAKYVDLVCQTCQKSAACAPKAAMRSRVVSGDEAKGAQAIQGEKV